MAELLKVFTTRAVKILSPNNINSFGINSHPSNYQSARFKGWLILCKDNNLSQLNVEMTKFLTGKDSIKSIDDLGKEWVKVVKGILALGNEIDKEKSYKLIKESKVESIFEKDKSQYITQRTAIADTILCLSQLKNLSHSSNIDYLTIFKVITFVERCLDYKMQLPEININNYFDRQIIIPSCFIKIDPCNPRIQTTSFPFLEASNNPRIENKVAVCTSEKCECKVNDACIPQSKCCAKPRIDVIDLMVVKDYTKCYQAGDLSYIKNVLEGEILSTKHRRLERTEELLETETEIKQFEEKYLQTEDKASLQKEMESIQKQDTAFEAGVTANADWGTYKIQADSKYSNNQSKSQTNKDIVNSSKEVIDRATKRVEENVKKIVSTRKIFETEENNEHTFNNESGGNISGQYLYVNKLSRAQVYNYGRKAVIDLVLPEPASLYKRLFETKFQSIPPVKPQPIELDSKSITPENYKELITTYNLKNVSTPPPFSTDIRFEISDHPGEKDGRDPSNSHPFAIPTNYYTTSFEGQLDSIDWRRGGVSCRVEIGSPYIFDAPDQSPRWSVPLPALEGNQEAIAYPAGVVSYEWSIIIHCALKEEFKVQWQNEVLAKITELNEKALAEYQKALSEYQKVKEEFELKEEELKKERYNKNPFINRETEKLELKRMVISYISCQFFDQFDAMKNRVEPCGYPEMNIREAEQEGKFIQFFEQAFNWNLITYIFYPYFWGKKCTWSDKLKDESNDLIFKKFLEAGSCRVLVPIRDGYFDYVSYFISNGEIWGGIGIPPLPNDPHYISVAQELKEQKQNFYADREGTIDVTNTTNTVMLNGSDHYWDYTTSAISTLNINADIDREIIIDCKVYRIVSIVENSAVSTHTSWIITIERSYEGVTISNLKWSTGAVFVGTPWEFITPTTLTFLRDKSKCLPCYPLKDCKEI